MNAAARESGYAITQNEAEMERLTSYARAWEDEARVGLARVGVASGWKAIDVGCGPLGVLPILGELVGPGGTVVGLDMHEHSLACARATLDQQGLGWVQLIQANINELMPEQISPPGPFDVAFCRNVLTHQADAEATLRRITAIVRPGGYIVAQNQMGAIPPPSRPVVPALERYGEWVVPLFERRGSRWVAFQHQALCRSLGLREVSQRGFFQVRADAEFIKERRDSLANWKAAIVSGGLATEQEVEETLRQFDEAQQWEFDAVFSSLYVELIAQVP